MGTPRLDSLTGMRFVAVILVFCSHVAFLLFEPRFSWISKTFDAGPVGVSFFFILSGFVLTWSARPQDDSRSFYRRRLARIGPNHLVAWLLALGVLLLEGATLGLRGGFASLFLVQAWVPSEPIFYAANSVTWSLSCEIAFYAAFPVLLPAMGHAPSASRKRWIVLLLLANVGIALFGQWALEGEAQLWFIYILPATRALEFAIGMLVALEVREGGLRSVGFLPAVLVALGAYAAAVVLPQPFAWTAVMTLPFALLIAAVAHNDLDGAPSPLRSKWIVLLGAWSYAFFLLHQLVIRSAFVLGDFSSASQGALLIWIPVLFLISIGASILLFRYVEHPLEARFRHSPGSAVGAQGSQG